MISNGGYSLQKLIKKATQVIDMSCGPIDKSKGPKDLKMACSSLAKNLLLFFSEYFLNNRPINLLFFVDLANYIDDSTLNFKIK